MKITFLRLWAIWRRLRRGPAMPGHQHLQYASQVDRLMRQANPFATWHERVNWMIAVADWIRREPRVSLLDEGAWRRVRHQRTRFLLEWLEANRDIRRLVQATLHRTLRESVGPELFAGTGMPREPAFFGDLLERVLGRVLPRAPALHDLPTLFAAMFPEPADAGWLLGLDHRTLNRLWRLCADGSIACAYLQQVDEALVYLATVIVAVGAGPSFRHRLGTRIPLRATPFMSLRRELEHYLAGNGDADALRRVRMLVAVCQAQTDRIHAHLNENGASVGLVYRLERMRAQLTRMSRLIDLRAAQNTVQDSAQAQALLVDLISAHHERCSVRGLVRRSVALFARRLVERNVGHGEQYVARDRVDYHAMFSAACIGGLLAAFTALLGGMIAGAGLTRFSEGAFASLNYAVGFMTISAFGGVLATRPPARTGPALASRMGALDTAAGLRTLMQEIAGLLRCQAAAVFGNLVTVVPTMALVALAVRFVAGAPPMSPEKAHASLQSLSAFGMTPLFAAFTGVVLWLASLTGRFADNWFALRRLREAVTHHRPLVQAMGTARAARSAAWLERNLPGMTGNAALGILLGMTPVLAQFCGLPLDVRHVTLSAATVTGAVVALGWQAFGTPEVWLAIGGVLVTGLLTIGVAFGCSLTLALRARDVPARMRWVVMRALLRRLTASPHAFLFPVRPSAVPEPAAATAVAVDPQPDAEDRPRSGAA